MSYIEAKVYMNNCIEVYKYYSGRFGKKIYNAPAQRKTPLKQIKYQEKKTTRICGWKIAQNFTKGDLWVTLTYPARKVVEPEKARKDISLFLTYLRRVYKKAGKEVKYIYTAGRTKRGMVHFHMVLNKFDTLTISEIWHKITAGGCHFKHLYVNEYNYVDYKKIADYLIKNSQETFYSKNRIHKKRFCASLNLPLPVVEKKVINAKVWKVDPKSIKGYILDKNSIYNGYGWSDDGNCWEGCRIQQYTLIAVGISSRKKKRQRKSKYDIPLVIQEELFKEEDICL